MATKHKTTKRAAKAKPTSKRRLIGLISTLLAVLVVAGAVYVQRYLATDQPMTVCVMSALEGQPVMICMSPEQFYATLAEAQAEIQKQAIPAFPKNDLEKQI